MKQRLRRSHKRLLPGIMLGFSLIGSAAILLHTLILLPQTATKSSSLAQTTPCQSISTICQTDMSFSYQGQKIAFSGFTFYPALFYGAQGWHRRDFPTYIDQMLSLAESAGLNEVRPTDMFDESHPGQRWDDPIVWHNIDYLIAAAKKHKMFVVMDLSAIKHLLVSQGRDPFDPTPTIWAKNWKPILDFVGHRFAHESSIAFYSILGEPASPKNAAERDRLVSFYRESTDELFNADGGHHLIAAGGFNHMEDAPSLQWWQAIYLLPHNTIAAYKTYSEEDINYIATVATWAKQHGKLAVNEEFGMQQGPDGESMRVDSFTRVYDGGFENGVRNFIFWNLGYQISSTSYEVSPKTPLVWDVIQRFAQEVLDLKPMMALQGICGCATCGVPYQKDSIRNTTSGTTSGGNPASLDEGWKDEEVWCIANANHTIITRRNGHVAIMGQCTVLSEGYDSPETSCILLARPTQSRPLFVQQVGGGTRRAPAKTNCIILDVCDVSSRHKLSVQHLPEATGIAYTSTSDDVLEKKPARKKVG